MEWYEVKYFDLLHILDILIMYFVLLISIIRITKKIELLNTIY